MFSLIQTSTIVITCGRDNQLHPLCREVIKLVVFHKQINAVIVMHGRLILVVSISLSIPASAAFNLVICLCSQVTMVIIKRSTVIFITVLSMVVICVVKFPLLVYLPRHHVVRNDVRDHGIVRPEESYDLLHFVPGRNMSLKDCEDLFVGTPAAGFNMSKEYKAKNDAFLAEIKRVLAAQPQGVEGYSHQLPTMFKAMHYVASRPIIKHICETGFNMGHSSFNFLTASKETIVHSFDLGNHGYAHSMAEYLNRTFGGRLFVQFGDSTKTVCSLCLLQIILLLCILRSYVRLNMDCATSNYI